MNLTSVNKNLVVLIFKEYGTGLDKLCNFFHMQDSLFVPDGKFSVFFSFVVVFLNASVS